MKKSMLREMLWYVLLLVAGMGAAAAIVMLLIPMKASARAFGDDEARGLPPAGLSSDRVRDAGGRRHTGSALDRMLDHAAQRSLHR